MRLAPALLLALLASACAPAGDKYPSLALRPIETRSDAEPVAPVVVATPDASLDAQLAMIDAQLGTTDAAFAVDAPRAEAAAKAAGARQTGSNAWLAAQSSLAEIEGHRGDTQGTVGDLEKMVTDRGTAGQPPYPALDALLAKAQKQLDAETAKVVAIKTLLGES